MKRIDKSVENLVEALKERAKELNCLYEVEELFSRPDATLGDIMDGIVRAIPGGWQYPDACNVKITYLDETYTSPGFRETEWMQGVDLVVQNEHVGRICVYYTEERPLADEGPFLKEERRLMNTIADRLERRIFHEKLKLVFEDQKAKKARREQWGVILDLLRRTDVKLLVRISRKMLNHLSWSGIEEANALLVRINPVTNSGREDDAQDLNRPSQTKVADDILALTDDIFKVANRSLGEKEVLNNIQKWIMEDRSNFLVKILEDPGSSLAEIANAIERFHHLAPHGLELTTPREKGFRVSLVRRLLNDDPHFMNIAKNHVEVNDFYQLLHHIIFPAGSHGKLGGKGSGLFLANLILKKHGKQNKLITNIRIPKTWYLTSDGIMNFINHNDLEEIVEQKYEDIAQVRQEYPYVVHVFKNSPLPPEILNGLSVALDDFGDTPLIVRSSSLLEDRMGTSFAGKYKSLFIANQGTKRERLVALMDAITEVYASTFSPDPIGYRIEHGMIDFYEEMGIMIQSVVGRKVGDYFLPSFAGVAFANNEFRWSSRIRREDGLVRMVPGLGTRAVDRVSDDYPILIAPGQPDLRVNVTLDEKVRYSPKKIDVINLKTNTFETMDIRDLLAHCGADYPLVNQLVSVIRDERLEQPGGMGVDFRTEYPVLTFEGLISNTPFVEQIRSVLKVLQAEMGTPVDLEFAHDGKDLYLLQCRSQSYSAASKPAVIPRDPPREKVIFSANRFITNGTVPGITHLVYVDPQKYGELQDRAEMVGVGRAVSRLNQMLPKRQFILMGPGRWGSRGDIRLGVNVSYSDINNTAMLIEIARKQKGYMPELSFGTHFFQDLVEESIRYLPLYPDDSAVIFNEAFLTGAKNILPELLPEFASLADTVRVIDLPGSSDGRVLQVLMNGENNQALAILTEPVPEAAVPDLQSRDAEVRDRKDDVHWRWRMSSVEHLADNLDPVRFGVKALYILGSTKNATAGPKSDIDIIIHFQGSDAQRRNLMNWLEGWSLCLSEANYLRTGYRTEGLLDVHIVTDSDIANRTSWATKIGAVTDAPRPLALGRALKRATPPPDATGGGR